MKTADRRDQAERIEPSWMGVVRTLVESMHFGAVQIVVHDSRVVQIERTEKLRLDNSEAKVAWSPSLGAERHQSLPPTATESLAQAAHEDFQAHQETGG